MPSLGQMPRQAQRGAEQGITEARPKSSFLARILTALRSRGLAPNDHDLTQEQGTPT
jgi:hypothetical protein